MRTLLATSISTLLAAAAAGAQTTPNLFEIYPDAAGMATTFATRGTLGNAAGELLQEVPGGLIAGVGDTGGTCTAVAMVYSLQDQVGTTQETYNVVLRNATASGAPDPMSAIFLSTNTLTPMSTNTGPVAWRITATFNTPVTLPCTGTWFMGIRFATATSSADILLTHSAHYTSGTMGDNPRATAPALGWQINLATSTVSQPTPRVFRFGVQVPPPVLNVGNVDPASTRSPGGVSFGAGGLYPKKSDGLNARVIDHANDGGTAHVLLGVGLVPTGLQIPGITGSVWVNPAGTILVAGQGSLVMGEATVTIVGAGGIPAAAFGTVYFQALTVNASLGNLRLSNATGSSL